MMIDFDMSVNRKAISAEMSEREHRSEISHVDACENARVHLTAQKSKIFDKLKEEQLKLAKKVVVKDSFDKLEEN